MEERRKQTNTKTISWKGHSCLRMEYAWRVLCNMKNKTHSYMAEKFQLRETENILKAFTEKQIFYKGTRTKKHLKTLSTKFYVRR